MNKPIIALLTDFGDVDTYVAEVKATILKEAPDAVLVDITHQVPPQNILQGAFLLMLAAKTFPSNTIFVAVIDPGVGGERAALIVKTMSGKIFIGPDNGLLYPAASREKITQVMRIKSELIPNVSHTFHGRDVFAHVAGLIAAGKDIAYLTEPRGSMVELRIPKPVMGDDRVNAVVLHADRFGNVITCVEGGLPSDWRKAEVYVNDEWKTVAMVGRFYSETEKGEPILLVGGTGYLELSVNRGNAAATYGIKPGDKIFLVKSRA
ncbi:MAG: SAM-dependent chlorinase/fluorinase [Candidatus Caldarchaeum sp.]